MLSCVSLFTGAGGFDIGLSRAGFNIIFATDKEPLCKKTYQSSKNFGPDSIFFDGDIKDVNKHLIENFTGREVNDLDLLVGGPPCPPYSKSRFYLKDKPRALNDPVGDATLNGYLRLLRELSPKVFLFENVQGFSYKVHQEGFNLLANTARQLGYEISYDVLNAADFGVPQIRKRFIMVGSRVGKIQLPNPTHSKNHTQASLFEYKLPMWRTAGQAISDIDTEENASDEGHYAGGKYNYLLKDIPPGDNYLFFTEKRGHKNPVFKWRSRYWSFLLKLSPDLPSWTIQARRSNNMGPLHWRNRILRIEEVKRLQTFPDNWELSGTLEQQWRQVGNAVPPLMAELVGLQISKHLYKEVKSLYLPELPSYLFENESTYA